MPAYVLSVWLGLSPEFTVHAFTYLTCLAGLGLAAYIARLAGFAENRGLFLLLPVFLALMVILPGNAFTERDHIGTALLAPLLVLTAWRIEASAANQPSWRMVLLAGAVGSVIVLVKPYYALVIAAPAIHMAWRRKSLRALFSPEFWVIGVICLTYLAAVFWLHPEFFSEMLPLLSEIYGQIKAPFGLLLRKYLAGYLLLLFLLWWIRPGLRLSPLVTVFGLAALAAVLVLAYQGKGWPYHAYAATAFGLTALLCHAVRSPFASITEIDGRRAFVLVGAVLVNALPFMTTQKPGAELVAAIRGERERPTVALIGSDIAAGHPLVRMVEGGWISAHNGDWLGAYSLYLGAVARQNGDPAADRFTTILSDFTASKLAELQRAKPEILLVQKEDALWRGYFEIRDGYAEFIDGYRRLAEDETVTAYVRE
jgi:hypothetical protein